MQENQAPVGPLGIPAGFFSSLFDMEFTNLITMRVIKFLYWLILMIATLSALLAILRAIFTGGPITIILTLILTPLVYLLEVVVSRVALEFVLVVFRMADDIRAISPGVDGASATSPASGTPPASSHPEYASGPEYPEPRGDPGVAMRTEQPPPPVDDLDEPWIT